MPLYKKAINFNPENLSNMSFEECYELLLIFRYLDARKGHPLKREFIKTSQQQLRRRMLELNPNAKLFPGII